MNVANQIKSASDSMRAWMAHIYKRVLFNKPTDLDIRVASALPKIYIYDLPGRFRPSHRLPLVSETYYAIYDFFMAYCRTTNPSDADYFFVPLNLIQYQFKNENPAEVLEYLEYYSPDRCDHLLVALGDFSQRSKKNHFGHAYQKTYDWLDNFILLALESTGDLLPDRDIGLVPFNTLSDVPAFNTNARPFLYSFLGELSHIHLPPTHVRSQTAQLPAKDDAFIGSKPSKKLKRQLTQNYSTGNIYELLARNSVFTLAPAGYGRWTYRFFQAIQWGSIPVLLSDDYIKPFADSIPYDRFCITLAEKEVGRIDDILRSIPAEKVAGLQAALTENQQHFTKTAFFNKLCGRLVRPQNSPARIVQ